MKRLCDLPREQLIPWRRARLTAGQDRYGDAHLQRYGTVDVMEELLDAVNITNLLEERVKQAGMSGDQEQEILESIEMFQQGIVRLTYIVYRLDTLLPDAVCTDERGGKRVWWSEQEAE